MTGTIASLANDIGVVRVALMDSIFMVHVFGDQYGGAYNSGLADAAN